MNKTAPVVFICLAFFNLAYGKDRAATKALWPAAGEEWLYYAPNTAKSADEAARSIESMRDRFLIEGVMPVQLRADRCRLRVKLKWVVTSDGVKAVPGRDGLRAGWDVPVSSCTEHCSKPRKKTRVILFNEIRNVTLRHDNFVNIALPQGYFLLLQAKDEETAKLLIDCLYTLMYGYTGDKDIVGPKAGVMLGDMTGKQKKALGIKSGALVYSAGLNGPAYGAGIRYPDVITEVDGKKVKDKLDCVKKISEGGAAVKIKTLRWAPADVRVPGRPTGSDNSSRAIEPGKIETMEVVVEKK